MHFGLLVTICKMFRLSSALWQRTAALESLQIAQKQASRKSWLSWDAFHVGSELLRENRGELNKWLQKDKLRRMEGAEEGKQGGGVTGEMGEGSEAIQVRRDDRWRDEGRGDRSSHQGDERRPWKLQFSAVIGWVTSVDYTTLLKLVSRCLLFIIVQKLQSFLSQR